jgi:hypothetical protein
MKLRAGILAVLLLTGCCLVRPGNSEEMLTLASSLTKLSAAVEATVRYKNPPPDLSDQELLELAVRHDPGLLTPFAAYRVRVLSEAKHAVVLVCTQDGKAGLLEDAGCNSKFDKHLWQEKPAVPCAFTMKLPDACQDGN